jgi:AcrR family transcriptional regulator
MKTERKKAERKEVILDAFELLIRKYGIDKTTMQEVAKEVGISVGTLYNEFADKEALIDALMARIEEKMNRRVANYKYSSTSPNEQLLELISAVNDTLDEIIRDNRSLAEYVFSGSQNFRYIGKKIHRDFHRGGFLSAQIAEIIKEGVKQKIFAVKEIESATMAITEAFVTYAISRVIMDEKERKTSSERWRHCFELMVRGLRE